MSRTRVWWAAAHAGFKRAPLAIWIWLFLSVPALAQGLDSSGSDALLWSTALAWLVPIGLGMLACGTVAPERVPAVMRVGWLALGLSVIGYWLCGFAFQFGGLGFASAHPDLHGLAREWSLSGLESAWGGQWGVIGLEGYLLRGDAGTPTALRLFWSQLPWITTAVALFLWSLQDRVWPVRSDRPAASGLGVLLVVGGLLQAALYTLVGNWAWGGGWLANLGVNLGWGHGFVDYGGSLVHLLGAASALAGMVALPARAAGSRVRAGVPDARQLPLPTLSEPGISSSDVRWTARDEPYVPMPTLHLPVLATAGAWLALLGWMGWLSSAPPHAIGATLPWPERMIGLLLAAAGGALCALFSSWLTTGEGDALMTARGVIGALVAVSAGLPFFPLWAALAVGAGAGLLVPLVQYVVDHLLRLEDVTSAVATHGASALWGLLAVGLFAGAGWNGVGAGADLSVEGQGLISDWPGQFRAQAFGVAAIVCVALFVSGLLVGAARGLVRAWYGEAVLAQRGRPARGKGGRRARRRRWTERLRVPWREWRWPQIGHLVPAWLRKRNVVLDPELAAAEPGDWPETESAEQKLEPFDLSDAEPKEGEAWQEGDAPVEPENPPDKDAH